MVATNCSDLLKKLWDLAKREAQTQNCSPDVAFEIIGLYLVAPETEWTYRYGHTPLNAQVFASTLGDGEHYSFLHLNEPRDTICPIVMTVPMALTPGRYNLIVGENLYEFLCLGCQINFLSLPGLAYEPLITIQELRQQLLPELGKDEYSVMQLLAGELNLHPWSPDKIVDRLVELQSKYLPLLDIDPEYQGDYPINYAELFQIEVR